MQPYETKDDLLTDIVRDPSSLTEEIVADWVRYFPKDFRSKIGFCRAWVRLLTWCDSAAPHLDHDRILNLASEHWTDK
jgi:hypothetical protein